jgi:hypothetical protein
LKANSRRFKTTFKVLPIATSQRLQRMQPSQGALSSFLLSHLDGEVVESVAVSSKSDDKKSPAPPNVPSVRDTLWWIPIVWRVLKWVRKRNRKKSVTTVRLRKDEEVIIRKKESLL